MVRPKKPHIELHDLITIFNDIIAKHVANINEKRDEISKLRTEIETKYALVHGNDHELIELKNANKLAHERIKELESTDHFNAAQTYQKELVKAERDNKILANELLAITNQTGTKARPKISINVPNPSDSATEAKYVIDRFVDFDHPHTIDILAKYETLLEKEYEEEEMMGVFDKEPDSQD